MKKIALVLVAILGVLALPVDARQNTKPLSEANLIDLLRNDVSPGRVGELAAKKGIDFDLTASAERDLRQAGANTELINALKKLALKPAPAVAAPAPATQTESSAKSAPGGVRINPKDGERYVWIPPGIFTMGCSPGDAECSDNEKPAHSVSITKAFWMGQTAVTVGAWKRYRAASSAPALPTTDKFGRTLNEASLNDSFPAVGMTWNEAKGYCEWSGGRLPTEAEWEYAARAGSANARYGDLDSIAWYGDNTGKQRIDSAQIWQANRLSYDKRLFDNGNGPHPVGQRQPNGWKLYDMLGNVLQWTADWYAEKYYAQQEGTDPPGPPGGEIRSLRGNAWNGFPRVVRVSFRGGFDPGGRNDFIGVRCVGE